MTNPLTPPLVALHVEGAAQRLRSSYLRVSKYAIWAAMLVGCPLLVFSREFFQLYLKEAYAAHAVAAPVMSIAIISLAVAFTNYMVWLIASAVGDIGRLMRRLFLAQMVNLGLTLYFVAGLGMGAIGAALASLIVAAVSSVVFYLPEGMRLTGLTVGEWWRRTVMPGLFPGLVACLALAGLERSFGSPQEWLELAFYSAAGGAVYVGVILLLCLDEKERSDVREALEQIMLRIRTTLRPVN